MKKLYALSGKVAHLSLQKWAWGPSSSANLLRRSWLEVKEEVSQWKSLLEWLAKKLLVRVGSSEDSLMLKLELWNKRKIMSIEKNPPTWVLRALDYLLKIVGEPCDAENIRLLIMLLQAWISSLYLLAKWGVVITFGLIFLIWVVFMFRRPINWSWQSKSCGW